MFQKRKKIWIDRFQTVMSVRIALYFILYQVAVWSLAIIESRLLPTLEYDLGPSAAFYFLSLLRIIVVVLGVLFIYDAVRLAHRFVGPTYRFRKALQAIASGEELELIHLRKGDYLQDMKDDFNEMLQALEQRGAVVLKAPGAKQTQKEALPV